MPNDVIDTDALRRLACALGSRTVAADDADRIDRIRLLEELKTAAAAAQAEEIATFAASQAARAADEGVSADRRSRGVAAQVGLAMRCSHHQATRVVGFATILCSELPATRAALRRGEGTPWRATLLARETAVLSLPDRLRVDAEFGPQLGSMGDRQLERAVRRRAYELDSAAAVARAARAVGDRRVTIRPAPDTMCIVSLLAPVAQGVAVYAALRTAADTSVAAGDTRGRGQIMADTLVERATGQSSAGAVPVEVTLVMPVDTLLGGGDEPGELLGHGPLPAAAARRLAVAADVDAARWVRRVYTRPDTGELIAMDSRRREFTESQRRFIDLRDRTCRTPWCDAPVRHADHVEPHAQGGRTHIRNGQGLCEACNYAKQASGWTQRARADGAIVTRTPTGHVYVSTVPSVSDPRPSPVERDVLAHLPDLAYSA